MLPLLSALMAAVTAGVLMRDGCRTATALALLINWGMNTAFVMATGDPYPWLWFIVTDYLTALAIFACYASRWQLTIIGIYAVQLISHVAFGLSAQGAWAHYYGWWGLYYLAWAQLIAFGGWTFHGLARNNSWLGSIVSSPKLGFAKKAERE